MKSGNFSKLPQRSPSRYRFWCI